METIEICRFWQIGLSMCLGPFPRHFEFLNMFATLYRNILLTDDHICSSRNKVMLSKSMSKNATENVL